MFEQSIIIFRCGAYAIEADLRPDDARPASEPRVCGDVLPGGALPLATDLLALRLGIIPKGITIGVPA